MLGQFLNRPRQRVAHGLTARCPKRDRKAQLGKLAEIDRISQHPR